MSVLGRISGMLFSRSVRPPPEPMVTPFDEAAEAADENLEQARTRNEQEAMRALAASQRLETANARLQSFLGGVMRGAADPSGAHDS